MQDDGIADESAGEGGDPAAPDERRERARRERARRERERRERAQRRRARREQRDTAETVGETCELVDSVRACGSGCGQLFRSRRGGSSSSGDVGCGCDGPCDLSLLRLSTLLFLAAAVAPARGADGLVRAAVRGYQRWLSRFTPRCPGTPSCSAFALDAVESLGVRRGLAAAAARVRDCGMPVRRA